MIRNLQAFGKGPLGWRWKRRLFLPNQAVFLFEPRKKVSFAIKCHHRPAKLCQRFAGWTRKHSPVYESTSADYDYKNQKDCPVHHFPRTVGYRRPRPPTVLRSQYPGSTYTLTYDPRRDQLEGVYFQAAMQQRFDMVFVRLKS